MVNGRFGWILSSLVILLFLVANLFRVNLNELYEWAGLMSLPSTLLAKPTIPTNDDDDGDDDDEIPDGATMMYDEVLNLTLDVILENRSKQVVRLSSEDRHMAFIHVGKAAGSTISVLLRNGCHEFLNQRPCDGRENLPNETKASELIESYFHVRKVPFDRFNSFVVVVRNPLSRVISSFVYEHPRNIMVTNQYAEQLGIRQQNRPQKRSRKAFACFDTLEAFATAFTTPRTISFNHKIFNCTLVARKAINGRDNRFVHFFWNYQKYFEGLPDDKELFVLRQTHLWEDWIHLNVMLGMKEEDVHIPSQDFRKFDFLKLPVKKNLSAKGRAILCKILKKELIIYKNLLLRASNLNDEDVRDSLSMMHRSCKSSDFEWLYD